jgi:hypothetical protein
MIEGDKLVPLFRLLLMGYPQNIADSMCEDIQAMVDAHTVDAVPVVYGKWINKEPPNADNNIYCTCFNCSAGDLHTVDAVVPYCWKCGAKMD